MIGRADSLRLEKGDRISTGQHLFGNRKSGESRKMILMFILTIFLCSLKISRVVTIVALVNRKAVNS